MEDYNWLIEAKQSPEPNFRVAVSTASYKIAVELEQQAKETPTPENQEAARLAMEKYYIDLDNEFGT